MAQSTTARKMIANLEAALSNADADVVSVTVDGTTTQFDRARVLEELRYWYREDARRSGRKPKISSINLGGAW